MCPTLGVILTLPSDGLEGIKTGSPITAESYKQTDDANKYIITNYRIPAYVKNVEATTRIYEPPRRDPTFELLAYMAEHPTNSTSYWICIPILISSMSLLMISLTRLFH